MTEEPSYMMFARANAEDGHQTPPSVVKALLERIDRLEAKKQDHSFRVTHERTGKVVYEGESYLVASLAQYQYNAHEQSEGRQPFWRMWLVDPDDVSVRIDNQMGF